MLDEMLDLVDEGNKVITTMPRSEVVAKNLKNFRVVCALFKNSADQLFIARRALNKAHYPGYLACIGGCVTSGEAYDEALHRETLEETAVDVTKTTYKFLGYLSPYEYPVNGYVAVYEIALNDCIIKLEEQDFCEGVWLSLDEARERIVDGEKITPNLLIILKKYYSLIF
jgi:NADH pyrophosphatase NudC (nudix superfamily)